MTTYYTSEYNYALAGMPAERHYQYLRPACMPQGGYERCSACQQLALAYTSAAGRIALCCRNSEVLAALAPTKRRVDPGGRPMHGPA